MLNCHSYTKHSYHKMNPLIFLIIISAGSFDFVKGSFLISLNASRESNLWQVYNSNNSIRIPAQVPGGIYTDLQASGILSDDLFDRFNDHEYRWVANEDWTYETTFVLTSEVWSTSVINLVFHGLDTVGDIYVNGKFLKSVNNMFVRYVVSIKEVALEGNNTLEIRFKSPIAAARTLFEQQKGNYLIPPECIPNEYQGECHVQQLRKMQASFAWDWGPAFPSVGIWKSVEIEAFEAGIIRDIYVTTTKNVTEEGEIWIVNITTSIESATDGSGMPGSILSFTVIPPEEGSEALAELKTSRILKDENKNRTYYAWASFSFKADTIKEWWPNNYADERKMYIAQVSFFPWSIDQEEQTKQVDFGFRTAELIEEQLQPDKDGLSFYLKINGVPIFAKGANWIPGHILPELSYDEAIVRHSLLSAKEANMNMIRVWGGGLYESDLFYQLADELGIMIWQDAMFASAMYPADDEFLDSVSLEIDQQVRRLRNHPSLVVWAGNNENEACLASNYFGTDSNYTLYKEDYIKLYVDTVAAAVQQNDPNRYFEVSCPSNGIRSIEDGYVADNPGSPLYGDIHHYNYNDDPWDSSKYPDTRFASEYGFQSWPSFKTLSAVSVPEDWNMNSEFCKQRQHHPGGLDQITHLTKFHFPLPDDDGSEEYFKTYIYYNQISQALAVKTETEKYRRDRSKLTEDNKGYTMGALYWMLNDVWQGPSWSSIEYGGRWKILHYYAKKFFSPVLISPVKTSETELSVYVVSDLLSDVENAELKVFIYSWDYLTSIDDSSDTILLKNSSSAIYKTIQLPDIEANSFFIYFSLSVGPDLLSENIYYPAPFTQVTNIPPAKISITNVEEIEGSSDLLITIETDRIAPFLWLETDVAGQFSDNGFTLFQNKINLTFSNRNDTIDVEQFRNTLSARSLFG